MSIFTRLRDFVGLNDSEDYDYEYTETATPEYQPLYTQEAAPASAAVASAGDQPEESDLNQSRRRFRDRATVGSTLGANMNNVIGMPGAAGTQTEVMVMEPRSFEEMPQAIQALRERKSVVLNLTMMDPDQAQRAVDFVAGGTYAIDGHQERVGESIFLFTPNCVHVTTQGSAPVAPPQPQVRQTRPAAPTPAWATEQVRVAQ